MSVHREIHLAIKALVAAALPNAKLLGYERAVSETIAPDPGGTIIGHPFETGEPEMDFSPPTWNFETRFPHEVKPRLGATDQAADIDAMLAPIGAAVAADRTLGGRVEWLEVTAADEDTDVPAGAAGQRSANFHVIARYATTDPLG